MTRKTPPPPRYEDWLAYLFDRASDDGPWWRDAEIEPWRAQPEESATLWVRTMENCVDLVRYTPAQIAHGLAYAINPSASNLVFDLRDKALPEPLRSDVISSIATLYTDLFTPRCTPTLSYGANNPAPLNALCYMFWDVTPLLSASPALVLPVLETALNSANPACQESALHGLGHVERRPESRDRIEALFASYLRRPLGADLRGYAERARSGRIT